MPAYLIYIPQINSAFAGIIVPCDPRKNTCTAGTTCSCKCGGTCQCAYVNISGGACYQLQSSCKACPTPTPIPAPTCNSSNCAIFCNSSCNEYRAACTGNSCLSTGTLIASNTSACNFGSLAGKCPIGPTCTAGTGSTSSSCGGHASYQCTALSTSGGTCCDYTYRCSGSSCISACNIGVAVSNCGGCCSAGYTWNGSTCVASGCSSGQTSPHYQCSGTTCTTFSGCGTNNCTGPSDTTSCGAPPPPPPPICGNSICEGGETCSTCPSDCGTCAPPPPPGISGKIYIDANGDNKRDCFDGTMNIPSCPGAGNYFEPLAPNNIIVNISDGVKNYTSKTFNVSSLAPNYNYSPLPAGVYTITIPTPPSGFIVNTTPYPQTATVVSSPVSGINIGLKSAPPPTYSISGTLFNDLNHDGTRDCVIQSVTPYPSCPGSSPEPGYSGATLTLTQGATTVGTTTSLADGSYSFTSLAGGTYNVNLTIPSGYTLVSSNPRTATLAPSATGIDFAITNSTKPWFQSVSGDMIQNGFTDTVPTGAASATPPYNGGGSYASVWGIGQTPGIIYSGSLDPDFGLGSASNPGWVAGNSSYPEPFVSGNTPLETSYNNVNALLAKYGKTATPLTSVCNPGDCNLSSIADGIYQYTGGGTVNFNDFSGTSAGFTLSGNKNVIILIDGTLNINEKIHVAVGSTLFITTSGNIVVDKSLGEAATDYCRVPWDGVYSGDGGCTIEGYYSTDKSFDLNGTKNCGINPDLRFNLGGSLVINASGIGGTLNLNRDLCSAGATYPTFSVTERADFVLYSPNFFKTQRRIWQEVNP